MKITDQCRIAVQKLSLRDDLSADERTALLVVLNVCDDIDAIETRTEFRTIGSREPRPATTVDIASALYHQLPSSFDRVGAGDFIDDLLTLSV